MGEATSTSDRSRLQALAVRVMRERGLDPELPAEARVLVAIADVDVLVSRHPSRLSRWR